VFYVITGGGLTTSLVYDASTQLWHEKAYLNDCGDYEPHRAATHIFAFGKHLMGDYKSGKIYEQSLDILDDDGEEIRRERIFTHLSNENNRFKANEIQIDFEGGVGLTTGQGSVHEMTSINPAPIREPLAGQEGRFTAPWVLWLQNLRNAIEAPVVTLKQTTAPTALLNQAITWQASESGTIDGQAYEKGDVLITSNSDGTSKTALVLDHSAL
jgi:hypothetical protein